MVRDEPDGSIFITTIPTRESQCNIILETDKGVVERVVKLSGTGNNMYLVNDVPFSNFGKTGIPEEVLDALGVSQPIEFGDLSIDLNFQNQLDTLFLVQGTGLPSIRGKVLGKVTNVDEVQRAIQLGASEEKQFKQELNRIQKEIEVIKLDQEIYTDLPYQESFLASISSQFERIEGIKRKKDLIESKREELKIVIVSAQTSQNVVNKTSKDFSDDVEKAQDILRKLFLLKDLLKVQNALNFYKNILSIELPLFDYNNLLARISSLTGLYMLASLQPRLHRLKLCANIQIMMDLIALNSLYDRIVRYKQSDEAVTNTYLNLVFYREQEKSAWEEQEAIKMEFEDLKKELKICPTCTRPFE